MLPSANTATGQIVYGIAATAIAAALVLAARLLSAQTFRLFVWVGRKFPEKYRPALREGADKIAPTWRKVGGVSRPSSLSAGPPAVHQQPGVRPNRRGLL